MTTKTIKLGKGRIEFDGISKPRRHKVSGVYKASFRFADGSHALQRNPRRTAGPNAVFRQFAMDGTSYHALLPFLEHREIMQARAFAEGLKRAGMAVRANAEAMLQLGQALGKTTVAVEAFGKALKA